MNIKKYVLVILLVPAVSVVRAQEDPKHSQKLVPLCDMTAKDRYKGEKSNRNPKPERWVRRGVMTRVR